MRSLVWSAHPASIAPEAPWHETTSWSCHAETPLPEGIEPLTPDELRAVSAGLAHVGLGMAAGAISAGAASWYGGGSAGQVVGAAAWGAVGGLWGATGGALQIINAGALAFLGGVAFGGGKPLRPLPQ